MNQKRRLYVQTLSMMAALIACTPTQTPAEQQSLNWEDYCAAQTPEPAGYTLTDPCVIDALKPTRILVTTTDFSSGALSVVHVSNKTIDTDIALGSTDAIPFYLQGKVFIVHRFGFDYIDVLDPENAFRLIGQHAMRASARPNSISSPELQNSSASPNPHALSLRDDGVGFVSLYGFPAVQVFDFERPSGSAYIGNIDMSVFGFNNSKTRLSLSFSCGDVLFTSVQRLNVSFAPIADELLAPVNMRSCSPYQVKDAITLLGKSAKQVRLDPRDNSGHTVLILTEGLEAVDLSTGTSRWQVPASLFNAEGISRLHLQSFAVHRAEEMLYFAAYAEDYNQVHIWRTSLSESNQLEKVLSGFNAVEKTLEIIGNELWIGNTSIGASGLRVFDLSSPIPTERAGPLSTGLPPYSVIAIP